MTYDTVATLQPGDVAADVRRACSSPCSPTRCGPSNKPRFEEAQRRALDLKTELVDRQGARMTAQKRDIDAVTGVETTGHEWDGVKELNKPLPRWWLLTFYATIVWAVGYWVVYPAWPTLNGYTKGMLGYSQRATVADEVKAAAGRARRPARPARRRTARADQARAGAAALCHGRRGGCVPGQLRAVPRPRRAGLRRLSQPQRRRLALGRHDRGHPQDHQRRRRARTRRTRAPRRCRATGSTSCSRTPQIADVAEYVLSLSGKSSDPAAVARGQKVFADQCANCHGPDGKGKQDQGAPNLADGIWLYGGSRQAIVESIRTGRGGMMPAWVGRLDPVTIKSLAVYVHSLGGGK